MSTTLIPVLMSLIYAMLGLQSLWFCRVQARLNGPKWPRVAAAVWLGLASVL